MCINKRTSNALTELNRSGHLVRMESAEGQVGCDDGRRMTSLAAHSVALIALPSNGCCDVPQTPERSRLVSEMLGATVRCVFEDARGCEAHGDEKDGGLSGMLTPQIYPVLSAATIAERMDSLFDNVVTDDNNANADSLREERQHTSPLTLDEESCLRQLLTLFHDRDYVDFVERAACYLSKKSVAAPAQLVSPNQPHSVHISQRAELATNLRLPRRLSMKRPREGRSGVRAMFASPSLWGSVGASDDRESEEESEGEATCSDSDEDAPDAADYGFVDSIATVRGARSCEDAREHTGCEGMAVEATDHSSCPPFPMMWRSATQNVLGTVTAAAALLSMEAERAVREEERCNGDAKEPFDPNSLASCQCACGQITAPIAIFPAGGRHHARRGRADGFCIFNDVVIAALFMRRHWRRLQQARRVRAASADSTGGVPSSLPACRILIIDIDAHHGDGTEDAFRYDSNVATVSVHGYASGFFPGTGGASDPARLVYNAPLPPYSGDVPFIAALSGVLAEAFAAADAAATPFTHCILVAGTDAVKGDPHGHLSLSVAGFARGLGLVVNQVAERRRIPLLVVGAGGYVDTTTARCWSHALVRCCAARFCSCESSCGCRDPLSGICRQSPYAPLNEVPSSLDTFAQYRGVNFGMW